MIKTEYDFTLLLSDFFKAYNYDVWREVPNMGQSVDMVISKNTKLSFIEVKISNWEKALQQCKAHELVADYIYVAIATKKISENLVYRAKEKGYGIIHFNWDDKECKISVKAKKNDRIWKPQRKVLKSKLKKISYE